MAGGVRAAVQRSAGIVIFDLQSVAAGLVEINRVGEMSALRPGDFCQPVFFFVGFDVLPRGLDFVVRADAKTVVIVEGFFRRVRPAFMHN